MAQVILLKDVDQLGAKGDVVDVTKGYLRNFLIPRKLASHATDAAIAAATKRMEEEERQKREAIERSQENATTLGRTVLTIEQQAGEDGRLFGSVTAKDIAEMLEKQGFNIDRKKIALDAPIKTLGEHKVAIKLHREVTAEVTVVVNKEEEQH